MVFPHLPHFTSSWPFLTMDSVFLKLKLVHVLFLREGKMNILNVMLNAQKPKHNDVIQA
jgi:hypothetical protein